MIRKFSVAFALFFAFSASPQAGMIEVSAPVAGADGVIVHWLGEGQTDVRVAVQVEAVRLELEGKVGQILGSGAILPLEAVASYDVASGEMELTRAKTAALRTMLLQRLPSELLTAYRDLDRGITWGADLVGIRVPVRVGENGQIVILPGMELGLRKYGEDVDSLALHASFVMEARAAYEIIEAWLSTGILARTRVELATAGMSGHEESVMGFMALALDGEHRLSLRVFGGLERDSNRGDLGLPATNVFFGTGLFGNFDGS